MKLTSDNFDEWSSNGTNELGARARVRGGGESTRERERERECSEHESRDECIVYFNTKCTSHAEKHERLVF